MAALKAKRLELAREQEVPPYVIFHDSTLLEILNQKPDSLTEMGRISGIGAAKLAHYGDAFLETRSWMYWKNMQTNAKAGRHADLG